MVVPSVRRHGQTAQEVQIGCALRPLGGRILCSGGLLMTTRLLEHRVERLEVQVRWWRRLAAALAVGGLILASLAAVTGQAPSVLRVRGLIVVDSAGRDRILLGAPGPYPPGGLRTSNSSAGPTASYKLGALALGPIRSCRRQGKRLPNKRLKLSSRVD